MESDWALIEFRPGRFAKVTPDGTVIGIATHPPGPGSQDFILLRREVPGLTEEQQRQVEEAGQSLFGELRRPPSPSR